MLSLFSYLTVAKQHTVPQMCHFNKRKCFKCVIFLWICSTQHIMMDNQWLKVTKHIFISGLLMLVLHILVNIFIFTYNNKIISLYIKLHWTIKGKKTIGFQTLACGQYVFESLCQVSELSATYNSTQISICLLLKVVI